MEDTKITDVHIVKEFGNIKADTSNGDVCVYFSPMSSSGIVDIEKVSNDDKLVTLIARNCKIDGCDIKTIGVKTKSLKLKTNGKDWKSI